MPSPEEVARRKADLILRHIRVPEAERVWLGFEPPTKTVNVPVGRVPMGTLPTAPMAPQTIEVKPAKPPAFDRATLVTALREHLSPEDRFEVLAADPQDMGGLIAALSGLEDKGAAFAVLAAVG